MNKYLVLFLWMFLMNIQMNAQPSIDKNWDTTPFFVDYFNPTRSPWDVVNWMDKPYDNKWKAHLAGCVTHGSGELMVYQKENAIFNSDGTMRLRAEYTDLLDTSDYTVPSGLTKNVNDGPLYYKSGAISVGMQKFLYGYFEMRCKLPVNRGAFPAFWLQDYTANNYREIDIFEYSWWLTLQNGNFGSPRYFEGQIYYYNGAETPYHKYGGHSYTIPANEPDLTDWHIFGMEWSPRRVLWYFDNKLVGSYVGDSMPSQSMNLIINNAVNTDALIDNVPLTTGFPNEMTIDYIKVSKLKKACTTDKTIQNNTQLTAYDYKVYKTLTIGGFGNDINIAANSNTVFRATNGITINGNFELPLGSSLELITQQCP
jgi:beta-glucanase (GH16 family)